MSDKKFPKSDLPVRQSTELLPNVFRTSTNRKFMEGVVDPLIQPGVLEKTVGYIGRRNGKTFRGSDIYLDTDNTLRSRYQLEPAVVYKNQDKVENFYDYLDFKNQLKFFGNDENRDYLSTIQEHYSWNPPIVWDKFINYREYYWVPSGPPPVSVSGIPGRPITAPTITAGARYRISSIGTTDFTLIGAKENTIGTEFIATGPGRGSGIANLLAISTYTVMLGTESSYIFRPDGYTNNPTITLYRGYTYKFKVNVPGHGFTIRTNYDTETLNFKTDRPYNLGQLVVYDGKLWRAIRDLPAGDGSAIYEGSPDWQYVDSALSQSALDYNNGVTNNGIDNGTITFEVPYNSPDVLFYQSKIDPDRFGKFLIGDIETDTTLDVERDIIGKATYTSGNGVEFSNGLIVEFTGRVAPAQYSSNVWLVEGVGDSIKLINFSEMVVPILAKNDIIVTFDDDGFDTEPFDDAASYPGIKDYITIERSSADLNPWSRYNRWFHKSVLEYAYRLRNQEFPANEADRAKRPIIEFLPNIQLFNHGAIAKQPVDFIESTTSDIFSTIEGSQGYIVDGEALFNGARLLVTSDTDNLVNNKIYEVVFIDHLNSRQISLRETADTYPEVGQCVLVRRGNKNSGLLYHYDGFNWIKSQIKTAVNQHPMFDAFDENEISFSDPGTYPINNFKGTRILGYKEGNGVVDSELGFSLSYLNIDNVGDIEFNWNWGTDSFVYTKNEILTTQQISQGFYKFNQEVRYDNGWTLTNNQYIQPISDFLIIENDNTTLLEFNSINWSEDPNFTLNFYLNGSKIKESYFRKNNTFTIISSQQSSKLVSAGSLEIGVLYEIEDAGTTDFTLVGAESNENGIRFIATGSGRGSGLTREVSQVSFKKNDVVTLKVITSLTPIRGYYEIPVGIEKNPLNQEVEVFTLGQASDHIASAVEFSQDFIGSVPGSSNLRDITGYQQYATRFMKHSSVAALSLSLLCDKTNNLIKSLQYSKKAYSNFKSNFLSRALAVPYVENTADFLDEILSELTKTKTQDSSFFDSDMIGTGAYTSIDYYVDDEGIKTFALSTKFTLAEPSRRAVYVYVNNSQLLNGKDYQFNDAFGFITVLVDVQLGDHIQIREYVSTSTCFIPSTPTSLGLYKKYTPQKFIDDTYQEPREVIQGHDGSITFAYGDFRDDLLLELEYRIYNNIKQEYDTTVFDIDSVLGGYYTPAEFNKEQTNAVLVQEFLKWIQNTDVNYVLNVYFRDTESFTYTYSNMTDPTGTQNLPGWWRGVYRWFYDTDTPHRTPWEMLGFSQKPDWWDSTYGPAPYTSNNLILWEDLTNGLIRNGEKAGTYDRYKRPSLLDHIPVDGDGRLLSPLDSGLAGNYIQIDNKGNFKFGDVSPVEHAWRVSSDYPFSLMIALALLKPFDFISRNLDRTKVKVNKIGQTVSRSTSEFLTLTDVVVPTLDTEQSKGLINYLVDYAKSRRIDPQSIEEKLQNLDVVLSSRLSGFVDKAQQKYLLDSKNPRSSSGSVYIPPENYDIIFNVSSPIRSVSYSGVIVEKTEGGWLISGYDTLKPYFEYFEPIAAQKDPAITVGGVSETFINWEPNRTYSNGQVVKYANDFYRANKSHEASTNFEPSLWNKLPDLPLVGGVVALRRRVFNTASVKILNYGVKLTSIQQVVDFLLGYEQYLISEGFSFDSYDSENQVSQNWLTSCKEFMFWTQSNWAIRSLISLSPSSTKINLTIPVGVADNFLDTFYDYQIFRSDGTILEPKYLNVNRTFQNIVIETTNTTDGIYFVRINYVLKENVVLFSDRTVFNDVIYDKTTGYRQERIKTYGFRTVDWDGDYTSPGFLFDNVNISSWQPFTDYKLGDIVEYQSRYWTSQVNQVASETFDDTKWSKLDSVPQKQLVSNFDYRVNQFEDYYDVAFEGIGQSQRELARHAIGYQERKYLQDLVEDSVTQFRLYQGFIREKGTLNSVTKVFDKLSKTNSDSIEFNEEWAFRLGRFGGVDQLKEIEFKLSKDSFVLDPQPIIFTDDYVKYPDDQYYRISSADFTIAPVPYELDVNVKSLDSAPFKVSGYVRNDQVNLSVKNYDSILDLNIDDLDENYYLWITFDTRLDSYTGTPKGWSVVRMNKVSNLEVNSIVYEPTTRIATISFVNNIAHNCSVGEIIGIQNLETLNGFYKIIDSDNFSNTVLTVELPEGSTEPKLLEITDIVFVDINNYILIKLSNQESIKVGEFIEFRSVDLDYRGSFKVIDKIDTYIKVLSNNATQIPQVGDVVVSNIFKFKDFRYNSYDQLDEDYAASLSNGTKIWIDNNGSSKWEVIEKRRLYASKIVTDYAGLENFEESILKSGTKVIYDDSRKQSIMSIPEPGYVLTYSESSSGLSLVGIINPPVSVKRSNVIESKYFITGQTYRILKVEDTNFTLIGAANNTVGTVFVATGPGTGSGLAVQLVDKLGDSFGNNMAISPDGRWLVIAAPFASDLNTKVRKSSNLVDIIDERSELVYDTGYINQGAIFVYERSGQLWDLKLSLASPSQSENEFFGTAVTVSVSNGKYYMAVSAPGADQSTGKVYLYEFDNNVWDQISTETIFLETANPGDRFGDSLTSNNTGTVLIVGAPNSDSLQSESVGKIFVYQKNPDGVYELAQTIDPYILSEIDDTDSTEYINSGDLFGYAVDLDQTGDTLLVSSPKADISSEYDRGAVYIFRKGTGSTYRLKQKISSFEEYNDEYFGSSLSITSSGDKIAVGAKTAPYPNKGSAGAVYVFDLKDQKYFLTEKLDAELTLNESFGESLDITSSVILVGSPNYKDSLGNSIGTIRLFRKQNSGPSWVTIGENPESVNIDLIKSVSLYDSNKNEKIGDVDFVDHAKLKILNIAEQELSFKTPFDPAIYSLGTDEVTQTIDEAQAWTTQNVGKLWWDLSTVKWVYYEQSDISYKAGNWNSLAEGASVDVYEWVETLLLPSEWSALADTNEGLALNISGQPLYPNDDVYSIKVLYNDYDGSPTQTLYYYWVKNSVVVPSDVIGRRLSAKNVSTLISDPKSSGEKFIAFIDSNQFLTYNFGAVVGKTGTVINIQYYKNAKDINNIHNEYQLLTEGVATSLPADSLEGKWIDSLVGYDKVNNAVPDPKLSPKQRYGLSYRPRQSIFVNRKEALKIAISNINDVLKRDTFADFISLSNLNQVDGIPDEGLRLYDDVLDTDIDLINVITSRLKQAKITASIIDGRIDSLEIIDPGFGYKVPPSVVVDGDGSGAKVEVTLDVKGRIKSVEILNRGKRYTTATVEVRAYSVLVNRDSTIGGFWSIYSWDDSRKVFYKTRTQSYDTTRYWNTVDWWKTGYSTGSRIVREILSINQEPTISVSTKDLIRVKEYGNGGWAVFERTSSESESFLDRYTLVGREKGTIEISSAFYTEPIGYDNSRSFDIGEYDIENFRELRNIFKAVKEDIFIGDYAVEWNKLFFSSIRYVFSEQYYIDWAFKTSFVSITHNVGNLEQKLNYKNDNLSSFQDYINEVKPFRTTTREYTSVYQSLENSNTSVTDFDLPPFYSQAEGKVVPVTVTSDKLSEYPWKAWAENNGFSVVDIQITDAGSEYIQAPTVLIEGNGTGATARAFITGGKVFAILVTNPGSGYTKTPTVSLVGGNGNSINVAKAVAYIGDSKVRNFRIGVKFDRITKDGYYTSFVKEETFVAKGYDSVFQLSYPANNDKSKIEITKNGQIVFDNEYSISLFSVKLDNYTYTKGKVIFVETPALGDIIKVTYEKADDILDSVNRIDKYYDPKSGMRGKDLPQLMTGIDFGGVLVQGSSFGVVGGWDALPWYTDYWDSIDINGDYYYVFTAPPYVGETPSSTLVPYRPGALIKYNNKIYKLTGEDVLYGESPDESDRWELVELSTIKLPYVPSLGKEITVYRNFKNLRPTVDEFGVDIPSPIEYSSTTEYNINDVIYFRGYFYRSNSVLPIQNLSPSEDFDAWVKIPESYRVDDPAWGVDDSSTLGNLNALMPTFIGDGINDVVEIGRYFSVFADETLIFRPIESDGSANVYSSDILDTNLSGGTLNDMRGAYITANGLTAEEIIVDGGVYISPDMVPAPEENIPGQVLDSINIKVFQKRVKEDGTPDDEQPISAFELHKDMLNMHYFKVYSIGNYTLAKDLNYYDTEIAISVNGTDEIITPSPVTNVPGTISINGERIEFLEKSGTTLKMLRRGVQGTSIGVAYPAGTQIANISYDKTIPYTEVQLRADEFYNTLQLINGVSNSYTVRNPMFVGGITTEIVNDQEVLVGNKNNIVIKITKGQDGTVIVVDRSQYSITVEDVDLFKINISNDIVIESDDIVIVYPLLIGPLEFQPTLDETTVEVGNSWYRELSLETITAGNFVIGETYTILSVGTTDFTEIGSVSNVIGTEFVATGVGSGNGKANYQNYSSIPTTYGQANDIEVFVGGYRQRKSPMAVYNEDLGIASPEADKFIEAEFSVDSQAYVRLTNPVENAGTRITIIKRTGRIWYESGENTASKGINLLDNDTPQASFIALNTTDIPE